MPTYVYQAISEDKSCDRCRTGFEMLQKMSEKPVTQCPWCNAPVNRVIQAAMISSGPSTKSLLSDKNLKQHGFSKLINEGGGQFRKI